MMGKTVRDLGHELTDWTAVRKITFLHVTAHNGTETTAKRHKESVAIALFSDQKTVSDWTGEKSALT